jgi:hypothetical protein
VCDVVSNVGDLRTLNQAKIRGLRVSDLCVSVCVCVCVLAESAHVQKLKEMFNAELISAEERKGLNRKGRDCARERERAVTHCAVLLLDENVLTVIEALGYDKLC